MSLLSEAMQDATIIDRTTTADGYGGTIPVYKDGANIKAAFPLMSAIEQMAAQQKNSKAIYRIVTNKNVNLQYHDVVRREEDKKIFRVTSDGDDNKTPASASLNMRVVDAEEWELPSHE